MAREEGGMVDDGALLSSIDDIHWNELCAEREHIECGTNTAVLLEHLWDHLTWCRREITH